MFSFEDIFKMFILLKINSNLMSFYLNKNFLCS